MHPKKPFKSPILCKIYHKRFLFQKDKNAYYSQLYSDLKTFIYESKAAYKKECYFAMEKLGYPPIDVGYALDALHGIEKESHQRRGKTYEFYFYSSMKRSKKWNEVRKDTIKKKLQLIVDYERRYVEKDKKALFLENLVHEIASFDAKNIRAIDKRTYRFAGKEDKSKKKELDVIVCGNKTGKFYGIECKAHDALVETEYYEKKLKQHFEKCKFYSKNPRNITLHPVFIVRICSDTIIETIKRQGGKIIQTERIWYNENKRLNERMRDELHHYFYSYIDLGKSPKSLIKKLDALES